MDLTTMMVEATVALEPNPDLLSRSTMGGRRRKIRRRALSAVAGVAFVSLGALAVPLTLSSSHGTVGLKGPLFNGQTHGDLAADNSYVSQVLKAWSTSHKSSENATRGIFDDLRGAPVVVWAGQTPAGPAAVVAQDAYLHTHSDIELNHEGIYQLLGFFGPGPDGAPRLVGDTYPDPDSLKETAWFVDQARTVLAVVDNGQKHGISPSWNYSPDGHASRTFTPINDEDGVGVVQLPAGTAAGVEVSRLPYVTFEDALIIKGGVPLSTNVSPVLDWTGHTVLDGAAPKANAATLFRVLDPLRVGSAFQVRGSRWWVAGGTPDGRTFVTDEIGLDNDLSRIYTVLTDASGVNTVIDSGPVDASAQLPVQVRLPDGQGLVIARYGAGLEWRTGSANWQPAHPDAALVPDAATEVRVTIKGTANVVDVSRP